MTLRMAKLLLDFRHECLRNGFEKNNFGLWDFPATTEKTMQPRN